MAPNVYRRSDNRVYDLSARSGVWRDRVTSLPNPFFSSLLNRLILFGEHSLRRAIREFVAHYHDERNHQGIGNRLIDSSLDLRATGLLSCRKRLGGMLNYYYRAAT